MTDEPGREPEQRLPAPRPPSEPVAADRFTGSPQVHRQGLTAERSAGIVRQSASARAVGLIASVIVVLFTLGYYFYELAPMGIAEARLDAELAHQQVVAVERGYNIYQANCANCHGPDGEGGIGPVLNSQEKLYQHLSAAYLERVLEVGGRYVCGNPNSLMPLWSNENGGPLNYRQIEELIAFLRATSDEEFEVRHPELNEPIEDPETGEILTFHGWRDPAWTPGPDFTPVPECWSDTGETPAPTATESLPPDAVTLELVGVNIAFDLRELTVPAGQPFAIHFINDDPPGVPHDVDIRTTEAQVLVDTPTIDGGQETTYVYEPLEAGQYVFICSIHPIPAMTGTLTVE